MITKNGSMIFARSIIGGDTLNDSDVIKYDGTACGIAVNSASLSLDNFELAIGEGTDAPAITDYTFAEISNARMQKSANQRTYSANGNIVLTRSYTNVITSNVTITEVAVYISFSGNVIVVAHDRLSEPIVAAPNETVTFSYEIAFN